MTLDLGGDHTAGGPWSASRRAHGNKPMHLLGNQARYIKTWTRTALFAAALCLLAAVAMQPVAAKPPNRDTHDDPRRIRMDSIRTLYFKDGMQTWSRRNKRLSQLQCVGNSKHLCNTYAPDIIMCRQIDDGAWRCEADLHRRVRLGAVDVSCEGWDGPHDDYILRGSCLLKYNLLPAYKDPEDFNTPYDKDRNSLMLIVIIAIFFAFLWYNNRRPAPGAVGPRGGNGGGGGPGWFGGGWGGGPAGPPQDPPPPYRPNVKPEDGSTPNQQQQQQGWRPGFWSGLGAGALASEAARVLAGNRNRQQAGPSRSPYSAPRNMPRYFDNDDDDNDPFGRGSSGRNSFGSAGPSSDTHRSMGFGGSSVR